MRLQSSPLSCAQRHPLVPISEQWLSAGAALGSILSAAHLLGVGAILLSGERCQDETLRAALGVNRDEILAGFISIGTIAGAPKPAVRPPRDQVWTSWEPSHSVGSVLAKIPVS
jgi:nitroreductase